MAASRFELLSLFLTLIFSPISADASPMEEIVESVGSGLSLSAQIELEQLNSKIHLLESLVDERAKELKSKDDTLSQREKVIHEKSNDIASLQSEIVALQKKETRDAEDQVRKAHARAGELENQVDHLEKELEMQRGKKVALEAQIRAAEEKMRGLNLKLEKLQKISDDQRTKIHKTERALQIAEEEMMKAKFEVTLKIKELMEVHDSWLPPWLAVHYVQWQSFMEKEWNGHGKPFVDVIIQKGRDKKAQAEKWAEPHVETLKTKWIPAMKEQWLMITTYLHPHVQLLISKTVQICTAFRSAITPHVVNVQQFVSPYYQEAKMVSKLYIDQVASAVKPHVDKVKIVLKPYTEKVVHEYGKFATFATICHNQVQGTVKNMLINHEPTKSFATEELVWFSASALLALPFIVLLRICSVIFG